MSKRPTAMMQLLPLLEYVPPTRTSRVHPRERLFLGAVQLMMYALVHSQPSRSWFRRPGAQKHPWSGRLADMMWVGQKLRREWLKKPARQKARSLRLVQTLKGLALRTSKGYRYRAFPR